MKRCPKCHTEFERKDADRCDECGWTKRKQEQEAKAKGAPGVGIEQCAWNSDGERCRYPGTIWRHPYGAQRGQGFCRFHAHEDCTAAYGAEIVRASIAGNAPAEQHARACQSASCPPTSRALPGTDLCQHCTDLAKRGETVARIRRPHWTKTPTDYVDDDRIFTEATD